MRERSQHLATVESLQTETDPEFSRWADTRLDRWLVDWSLRMGKERTARQIAQDRGIEVSIFPNKIQQLFFTPNTCSEFGGY